MSTLREAAEPDWLDEEPFYNAMQRYRCAPREDQREVVACFEAVKRLVRAELAKPDARPAPAEPQPIAAWSIVRTAESAVVTAVRAALSAAPAPQPAGGEPQPAAQQEPLTVDYSGCDICARETATIAGFRLMVDPSLPPDVLVFRQGEREVGRIINAGITATKGER